MNILLLGGPSGTGKSFFASHHLASLGWVHLEIDQYPKEPRALIVEYRIKSGWDNFCASHRPKPLCEELSRHGTGFKGVVLSMPSDIIFSLKHLQAAAGHFQIAYFYGHPAHCLRAFLQREAQTGRGLPATYWDSHNQKAFAELCHSFQHPFLIEAFNSDGSRRELTDIYEDIFPDASSV